MRVQGRVATEIQPMSWSETPIERRNAVSAPVMRMPYGIPDEMAAGLVKDAAFPKRMGRPIEYARMALAIIDNPMLNGSTIRLDAGQRFAPK